MSHVYPGNILALVGKSKVGGFKGNCVDLVRGIIPSLKDHPTSKWKPGEKVSKTKSLKPGTAIATFLCGRYPQDGITGKHAAIFLRYMGPKNQDGTYNSILILDQWENKPALWSRVLDIKGNIAQNCSGGLYDASNSLDNFYVIK